MPLIKLILVILLQVIPKDCEQSVWKSGYDGRSNGAQTKLAALKAEHNVLGSTVSVGDYCNQSQA